MFKGSILMEVAQEKGHCKDHMESKAWEFAKTPFFPPYFFWFALYFVTSLGYFGGLRLQL